MWSNYFCRQPKVEAFQCCCCSLFLICKQQQCRYWRLVCGGAAAAAAALLSNSSRGGGRTQSFLTLRCRSPGTTDYPTRRCGTFQQTLSHQKSLTCLTGSSLRQASWREGQGCSNWLLKWAFNSSLSLWVKCFFDFFLQKVNL